MYAEQLAAVERKRRCQGSGIEARDTAKICNGVGKTELVGIGLAVGREERVVLGAREGYIFAFNATFIDSPKFDVVNCSLGPRVSQYLKTKSIIVV